MAKKNPLDLGKRERQIMEVVYRLGEASVSEVRAELREQPGYSAVRGMLGLLVSKRVLRFRRDGKRYLYRPTTPREQACKSVLRNLLSTFFGGSPVAAMAALLDVSSDKLNKDEFERMKRLIEETQGTRGSSADSARPVIVKVSLFICYS